MNAADHLSLAVALVRRFCRPLDLCQADRDDAQQEACLALVKSAQRFRGDDARAWSTYAGKSIMGALRDWLRRRSLWAEGLMEAHAAQVPERTAASGGGFLDELRLALERLPVRQRDLLTARFDLDGLGKRTLEELGNTEGVTKEAIRVREKKALERLTTMMGEKHGEY